jgi:serpin B
MLPEAGGLADFEGALDAERIGGIVEALEQREVALTMPRFEFDSGFSLNDMLRAMGMEDAFSEAADFSGMTGTTELFISSVIHKAFVSVDEEGTEAAAATAVVMVEKAMPAEPVELTVDRPFVFLIRDIETGAVLFVGRVVDPA